MSYNQTLNLYPLALNLYPLSANYAEFVSLKSSNTLFKLNELGGNTILEH